MTYGNSDIDFSKAIIPLPETLTDEQAISIALEKIEDRISYDYFFEKFGDKKLADEDINDPVFRKIFLQNAVSTLGMLDGLQIASKLLNLSDNEYRRRVAAVIDFPAYQDFFKLSEKNGIFTISLLQHELLGTHQINYELSEEKIRELYNLAVKQQLHNLNTRRNDSLFLSYNWHENVSVNKKNLFTLFREIENFYIHVLFKRSQNDINNLRDVFKKGLENFDITTGSDQAKNENVNKFNLFCVNKLFQTEKLPDGFISVFNEMFGLDLNSVSLEVVQDYSPNETKIHILGIDKSGEVINLLSEDFSDNMVMISEALSDFIDNRSYFKDFQFDKSKLSFVKETEMYSQSDFENIEGVSFKNGVLTIQDASKVSPDDIKYNPAIRKVILNTSWLDKLSFEGCENLNQILLFGEDISENFSFLNTFKYLYNLESISINGNKDPEIFNEFEEMMKFLFSEQGEIKKMIEGKSDLQRRFMEENGIAIEDGVLSIPETNFLEKALPAEIFSGYHIPEKFRSFEYDAPGINYNRQVLFNFNKIDLIGLPKFKEPVFTPGFMFSGRINIKTSLPVSDEYLKSVLEAFNASSDTKIYVNGMEHSSGALRFDNILSEYTVFLSPPDIANENSSSFASAASSKTIGDLLSNVGVPENESKLRNFQLPGNTYKDNDEGKPSLISKEINYASYLPR